MRHELQVTAFFNHIFGGAATAFLTAIHLPPREPAYPLTDWFVCETLVVLFILLFFGIASRRFSVERPGKVQHVLELGYEFIRASSEEIAGHDGPRYLAFFGTIFIFILFLNLIGLVPGFDSPTMYPMVPLGFAVATFFFYHAAGIKQLGPRYIKQFMGPMLAIAPLMFIIEIVSHFARPLSLTVRLWANLFAGEQVYLTVTSLTKVIVPVIFIGLHAFVGFLQAYIFMLLAMVYVGGAIAEEH